WARGERVLGDHGFQVDWSAENDAGVKAGFLLDGIFDARGEASQVALGGAEHDVAALQEGLRIAEAERIAEGAEVLHLDLLVAGKIDAAEQTDEDGHGELRITTKETNLALVCSVAMRAACILESPGQPGRRACNSLRAEVTNARPNPAIPSTAPRPRSTPRGWALTWVRQVPYRRALSRIHCLPG